MSETTLKRLQAQNAAAQRWDRPDKDEVARDYTAARLADYIKRVVDEAPPLTAEQRDKLSALLRSVPPTSGSGPDAVRGGAR